MKKFIDDTTTGKTVVLISSGQPSLNPRLVKEADALAQAGYVVTVLYAYWNDWATVFDEEILKDKLWKAVRVGGDPKNNKVTYFISRCLFKIAQKARRSAFFEDRSLARGSHYLINRALKTPADLYIAHNLGALPAAVKAARRYNKPCGFDAEDLHRYEISNDEYNEDVRRKSIIEDKYIPLAKYFTTSSPQIARLYQKFFPDLKPMVILNVFNKSNIRASDVKEPLKLFWFSQTVGPGRGIEDVVEALSRSKNNNIELHLLGHRSAHNDAYIDHLSKRNLKICFHDPISPNAIIEFAKQFDVGLALEPGFSINNDAALSNKIFTYMQAGLAIIATTTSAQANFMQQNPAIGHTYNVRDIDALVAIITKYERHPDILMACKKASLALAHEKYNWETEQVKFLTLVKKSL